MNPLGVHALVLVGGWNAADGERAIDIAAACGYQIIEIPVHDPSAIDVRRTQRQLERARVRPVAGLDLSFDTDVSSGDPELVARGEARLNFALSVARDLGASLLTGVLYSALGRYLEPPSEAGRWNCVRVLHRVAERAAASGMAIGLEPVNRYETNLLNTASQALALIDAVEADNVVVHLNSYHMNMEEGAPAAAVERCGPRLGYVHVGESHRGYLGSGTVSFGSLFAALDKVGYDGPITFEAATVAMGGPLRNGSRAVWRQLWSDSGDLARHARQFMTAERAAAQHRVD